MFCLSCRLVSVATAFLEYLFLMQSCTHVVAIMISVWIPDVCDPETICMRFASVHASSMAFSRAVFLLTCVHALFADTLMRTHRDGSVAHASQEHYERTVSAVVIKK